MLSTSAFIIITEPKTLRCTFRDYLNNNEKNLMHVNINVLSFKNVLIGIKNKLTWEKTSQWRLLKFTFVWKVETDRQTQNEKFQFEIKLKMSTFWDCTKYGSIDRVWLKPYIKLQVNNFHF